MNNFITLWNQMSTPKHASQRSVEPILNTNVWLTKDSEGRLGITFSGVTSHLSMPDFTNLNFSFEKKMNLKRQGKETIVSNCLFLELNQNCEPELLLVILDHMSRFTKSEQYTTEMLKSVLNDVWNLVKKPPRPPSREEVIGVWGELRFIEQLLELVQGSSHIHILRAWEADGPRRDIIDFRFTQSSDSIAVEVKTTTGDRIHHIHSLDQITVPEGFAEGYLLSVQISEESNGRTVSELVKNIRRIRPSDDLLGSQFIEMLESKLADRGPAIGDNRFRFVDADSSLFFKMKDIPRPMATEGVVAMEWQASLENSVQLSDIDNENLIKNLIRFPSVS